jgi:hypothetical protein
MWQMIRVWWAEGSLREAGCSRVVGSSLARWDRTFAPQDSLFVKRGQDVRSPHAEKPLLQANKLPPEMRGTKGETKDSSGTTHPWTYS